jgi:hypothetical protein
MNSILAGFVDSEAKKSFTSWRSEENVNVKFMVISILLFGGISIGFWKTSVNPGKFL